MKSRDKLIEELEECCRYTLTYEEVQRRCHKAITQLKADGEEIERLRRELEVERQVVEGIHEGSQDEISILTQQIETLKGELEEARKQTGWMKERIEQLNKLWKDVELKDHYQEALEKIAEKSVCACWDAPGFGSGRPYVWIGCAPHNSDDPEEWCLCCIAHEALNQTNLPSKEKENQSRWQGKNRRPGQPTKQKECKEES